jgi:hypothetical protein
MDDIPNAIALAYDEWVLAMAVSEWNWSLVAEAAASIYNNPLLSFVHDDIDAFFNSFVVAANRKPIPGTDGGRYDGPTIYSAAGGQLREYTLPWAPISQMTYNPSDWVLLDDDVQSYGVDTLGDAYELKRDGTLAVDQLTQIDGPTGLGAWSSAVIDSNVRSFALGSDGTVYDLQPNGDVKRFCSPTGTWLSLLDSGVASMALGRDGVVYDLKTNGDVTRWYTATDAWLPLLDTNVVSMVLGKDGTLYDLHTNGVLYQDEAGSLSPIDSSVRSIALAPDGTIVDQRLDGSRWKYGPSGWTWIG